MALGNVHKVCLRKIWFFEFFRSLPYLQHEPRICSESPFETMTSFMDATLSLFSLPSAKWLKSLNKFYFFLVFLHPKISDYTHTRKQKNYKKSQQVR